MKQDLFFKGEIPALESDKEGKLRGGFCELGGEDISFYSNTGCSDIGCVKTNKKCTNTCSPDSQDHNIECTNYCGTTDTGCSHGNNTKCPSTTNGQKSVGLSFFNLGSSTLF